MENPNKQIEIKCRFCGKTTGSIGFVDQKTVLSNMIEEKRSIFASMYVEFTALENSVEEDALLIRIDLKNKIEKVKDQIDDLVLSRDQLPDWTEVQENKSVESDFADNRCSECEVEHGSYKEMYDTIGSIAGATAEDSKFMIERLDFSSKEFGKDFERFRDQKDEEREIEMQESLALSETSEIKK